MSGVTDPYQPIERRLRLARGCLEVLCDYRNPVVVVTKNHLVTRDIDLLSELARHGCARGLRVGHDAAKRAGQGDGAPHLDPGATAGRDRQARGGRGSPSAYSWHRSSPA